MNGHDADYDAGLALKSPRVNRRCCLATDDARTASVDKRLVLASALTITGSQTSAPMKSR